MFYMFCLIYVLIQVFCLVFGKKAMIAPIPKDSTKDKRIPLNYRGISLLSVVSKLYLAVINNRFFNYLEDENLLAEEQNGFP